MKLLLTLSLSLFTSVAFSCTDFSGSYVEDSSGDTFSLLQEKCSKVTLNTKKGTITYITDGKPRVTEEYSELRVTTAASFIGKNLTVESKIEYLQPLPKDIPAEFIPVKVITVDTKDAEGNVSETTFVYNGSGGVIYDSTSTYKKL